MKKNVLLALFPPGNREEILKLSLNGEKVYERYMLYGVDRMMMEGMSIKTNLDSIHNLHYLRPLNALYKVIAKKIIGSHGEISWASTAFTAKSDYRVILSFSEKCLYPILFFRYLGFLRGKKIILISIGLSEKLHLLTKRGEKQALKRLLCELQTLSKILTFSWHEQTILRNEYHLKNVMFLPLGVDVDTFKTVENSDLLFDVVSVGADKNRDFAVLINVAKRMCDRKFLLITNKSHAEKMRRSSLPENIEMKIDIPMGDVCSLMDAGTVVFLPVKENLYSGATTCLLQAMSLSKAVVTTQVAPISCGYGLMNKENVVFVEPGNSDMAVSELTKLLFNKQYRNSVGKAARSHVEQSLTLDRMVSSIKRLVLSELDNDLIVYD